MKQFSRWVVVLIGVAMPAWGAVLISLEYLGASATPYEVSARRQGGDDGDVQFNRYNWSIHYEFRTAGGEVISGTSTAIGTDHAVRSPELIRYFPGFPYINGRADDTGRGLMSPGLITSGLVLLWAMLRRVFMALAWRASDAGRFGLRECS